MLKNDHLLTLKEAVIYSNHTEENIRDQIERGNLTKYDIDGIPLKNPLREKGFFRLSELMDVYGLTDDPKILREQFFLKKNSNDSAKNIIPAILTILSSSQMNALENIENNSIDTWILLPLLNKDEKNILARYNDIISSSLIENVRRYLGEAHRILRKRGNIIIHSIPKYTPYLGVELYKLGFVFKYWITYSTNDNNCYESSKRFTSRSNSILYFVNTTNKFRINRVREPYRNCSFCNQPLKDYGGKKHLRHKDGMVVSDVWFTHSTQSSLINELEIPIPILKRIIDLSCSKDSHLLLGPYDGVTPHAI